jgi:hypothetical protein
MYERTLRMRLSEGAESLIGIVEPFFDRSWDHFSGHEYTPPRTELSEWSAVAQSGSIVIAAAPLFEAFGSHGAPAYRTAIGTVLSRLLPSPLVKAGGPVHLETTVIRTDSSTVVHLLSFLATRVATSGPVGNLPATGLDLVEDPFPLVEVPVAIRCPQRPAAVYLQPAGVNLPFDWDGKYAEVVVTVSEGHAMLVLTDDAE